MRHHRLSALLALLAIAVASSSSSAAGGGAACATSAADNGYAYAGHQATSAGHGVRATIALTRAPEVAAGHVAGWVGVGGPGQGARGEDAWIQAGIASVPGTAPFLYAEVVRGGSTPRFVLLREGLAVGESHDVAVLESPKRPGTWRVLVDGRPATAPVRLRGSSGRWAPIATAESWNGGRSACNTFAFRFERVSVTGGGGLSWRAFVPGHRFLSEGYRLRSLAGTSAPYAFLAASS